MTLVPSLLQAIIRLDGEAVVMHVGDRPYVVTPTGQVDLATRGLTFEAVTGIVNQLLPIDSQRALDEFGAAQYELPAMREFPGEHFTIVAARGGDDVWAEIRRRRMTGDDRLSLDVFGTSAMVPAAEQLHPVDPVEHVEPVQNLEPLATPWSSLSTGQSKDDALSLPDAAQLWPVSAAMPTDSPQVDDREDFASVPVTEVSIREAAVSIVIDGSDDLSFPDVGQLWPESQPSLAGGAGPLWPESQALWEQPLAPIAHVTESAVDESLAESAMEVPSIAEAAQPAPILEATAPVIASTLPPVAAPISEVPASVPFLSWEAPELVSQQAAAVPFTPREEVSTPVKEFAQVVTSEIPEPVIEAVHAPVAQPVIEPVPVPVAEVPQIVEPPVLAVVEAPGPVAEAVHAPVAPPVIEPVAVSVTEVPRIVEPAVPVVAAAPAPVAEAVHAPVPSPVIEPVPVPVAEMPQIVQPAVSIVAPALAPVVDVVPAPVPPPVVEPIHVPVAEVPHIVEPAVPVVAAAPTPVAEAPHAAPRPVVEPVHVPVPEVPQTVRPPALVVAPAPAPTAVHQTTAPSAVAPIPVPVSAASAPALAENVPAWQPPPPPRGETVTTSGWEAESAGNLSDLPLAAVWQAPPEQAREPLSIPAWQTPAPARAQSVMAPGLDAPPAAILPLARHSIRPDVPPPLAEQALSNLDHLLRLAAARGASMLYLSSASRPSVRVDGEIYTLDGAPVLGPNDVESLLLTLMPERNAEALRTGVASEWICELPDVGRVRCLSFRDHRGPGGVFRMMPVRAITAEQLGLTREIQALPIEPEGLVLVAGPRASGKRTLMSAFVDLINRTRRDHIISIESEINVVHERNGSFVSQREVRGGADEMYAAARGALREDPDVLVLEEVRTAALMNLALEAAASGHLVIGGFPAHNATGAVDRIIDLYPPENRRQVQLSLAQNLRGVVSQVLLRKRGGGRLAAREVLLNTPAVASVLAEGRTSQLPLAIEGGRKVGMMPLNDALVGFVQSGAVDVQEAFRRSADRAGFLALLKRQGVDTSAVERLA